MVSLWLKIMTRFRYIAVVSSVFCKIARIFSDEKRLGQVVNVR